MTDLAADVALRAGGWDPRYAVALAVASLGALGCALIDANGDGADLNLEQYERAGDGRWLETGSASVGEAGGSWSGSIAAAWGSAHPEATVTVEYLGRRHSVRVEPTGRWLFLGRATEDADTVPRRIDLAPR